MSACRWRIGGLSLLVLAVFAPGDVHAQSTTWHGQIRPRAETRDPSAGGGSDTFTTMRVRLGLEAVLNPNLSVFIQAQDVRTWGEETHPLFDFRADNLDVHQAYFRFEGRRLEWMTATVGRMETNLGGQRLVGAVNWAQQGQSFDGARVDLTGAPGSVSLVGYTIADLSAPTASENRQLFGAYGTRAGVGPGDLDVYWLYARARAANDTDEHAIGARYVFDHTVRGRVEGTVQTGTRAGVDVSAFMLGARVGTTFADGRATATLWYDYLSGDDPATPDTEVFNTFYATNHKFYGFADIFTNIPAHTGGAGLQDLAAKLTFRVRDDITAGADLHRFSAAEQGSLTGTHFADELDLYVTATHVERLEVTAGFSYVVQDGPLGEVGRLGEDQTWFYVMFDAIF